MAYIAQTLSTILDVFRGIEFFKARLPTLVLSPYRGSVAIESWNTQPLRSSLTLVTDLDKQWYSMEATPYVTQ